MRVWGWLLEATFGQAVIALKVELVYFCVKLQDQGVWTVESRAYLDFLWFLIFFILFDRVS